jgi:hypothetical protein
VNCQRLFIEFDGFAGVAQGEVGIPQIAEGIAFAAAVADFPRNRQRLFIEFDGFAGVAQGGIGKPQIAEPLPSPRRSPISGAIASACS